MVAMVLWPVSERPRERLLSHGARALADAELLALVLGSGPARAGGVMGLCRRLLAERGDLRRVLGGSPRELMEVEGIGPARACALLAAAELGRRSLAVDLDRGGRLTCSADVYRFIRPWFVHSRQELFFVLALDAKNRVVACRQVAQGTVTGVDVHPREVFAVLVQERAASAIVAHNHPSGDVTPSADDLRLTDRLAAAGQLMGIPLLDHLVVGDGYTSLADRGRL